MSFVWKLMEVCESKKKFLPKVLFPKPHTIPGTIEAEDYDTGCPGDAYYDSDKLIKVEVSC